MFFIILNYSVKNTTMKVKKFICKRCKAPKVTKIETSYVVCDYCASLVDVDLTTGHKEFYADEDRAIQYEQQKEELHQLAEQAFENNDQEAFYNYQHQYWKMYLETYPEYIIPNVTPAKFDKWVEICALCDVYFKFKTFTQEEIDVAQAQQNNYQIEFYEIGEDRFATWETFFRATEIYYKDLQKNLKEMRMVPELSFMDEVFPLDLALKKEMSMYAQMWLPYLEGRHHDEFLSYIGLKTEYIDLPPIAIEKKECVHCKAMMDVPEGAIRSKCSRCNTDNTWSDVPCLNCNGKNELPEDWQETISCVYCTSEIRVINKLFG